MTAGLAPLGAVVLGGWDWVFLLWFLAVTIGVGIWYARRASADLEQYFVSGRDLPWWALGTSMVATTFAADTPLAVTGFIFVSGIAYNWVWWSFLIGGTLTVFVFARWWRRSGVTTEIELIDRRYDGPAARGLRAFKAVYLGLVVNALIIGWVTVAMGSIVQEVFAVPKAVSLGVLIGVTLVYTSLSGLWGVVATDVLQFVMAMLGSILLAALCVAEVGGLGELVARVRELGDAHGKDYLSLFPAGLDDALGITVLVLVLVNWWAVYYPGNEPGGGGYIAQRMFAAKDERHARAGTLWFIVAHYVLRPWPWILVALCALVLRPEFAEWASLDAEEQRLREAAAPGTAQALQPEKAYPAMFDLLPVGLLGLVVASFFAAFMSTMTTQLNLASSYLVNDLYLPFLHGRRSSDRRKVLVARVTVGIVAAAGCLVAWYLEGAGQGWLALMELTAGTGLVLIARWLWWRVNAWSEITAMAASAALFTIVRIPDVDTALAHLAVGEARFANDDLRNTTRLVVTAFGSSLLWIGVTVCTRPVATPHLVRFYERVRPGGWWAPIATAAEIPQAGLGLDLAMWGAATVLVFGALLGLGSVLLGSTTTGLLWLAAAAAGGIALGLLFAVEARRSR